MVHPPPLHTPTCMHAVLAVGIHVCHGHAGLCEPVRAGSQGLPLQPLVLPPHGALFRLHLCQRGASPPLDSAQWGVRRSLRQGELVMGVMCVCDVRASGERAFYGLASMRGMVLYSTYYFSFQLFMSKVFVMYIITIIGGLFYASQFPEKMFPGIIMLCSMHCNGSTIR